MKVLDPYVQRGRWLNRALCRRYAVVVFSTISKLPEKNVSDQDRTIRWAFGSLINGDCEVLGAWNLDTSSATPRSVFGDLYVRGVEFVRCGLGNLGDAEAAFLATFRNAALVPSIEQAFASAIGAVKPRHRVAMSNLLRASLDDPDAAAVTVSLPGISSEDLRQKYPGILGQWDQAVAGLQSLLDLPESYRALALSVDRTAIGIQTRLMRSIQRHGRFVDSAQAFDFAVDALMRADLRLQRDAEVEELARVAFGAQSGRLVPVSGGAVGTPALA